MYTSPIEVVSNDTRIEYEDSIMKAIQNACVEVNKQELIRALQYDRDQYDKGYADGYNANKWISVEDRLPEKDEYVFCYSNKYGGIMFVGYRGWYSGEWMDGGMLHIGEVTHWMPLPEAPTQKGC